MSSSAPDLVTLPHTWRPLGVRIMGAIGGAALVGVLAAVWFGFSESIRSQFTIFEIVTMWLLGGLAFAVWFALMRCRITATESGLLVVNGYRYREFEWAQVVGVYLRRGAPWATIDLSDGTTVSAMGIQGSDGQRGIDAARQLKALAAARSAAEPS